MACIGELFIAGTDSHNGKYPSGIAYDISCISKIDFLYDSPCGNWQVEIKKGSNSIVARCIKKLSRDALIEEGFEQAQRALDILSIKGICSVTLQSPAQSNTGVYYLKGKSILFHYSLSDLAIGVECKVTQTDKDGNVIQQPLPPEPIWKESFRYYRLSQSSSDLFEAYRNLFLGFEALLNEICPKKAKEGEGDWFKRSLTQINTKINLHQYIPTGSTINPVDYIIKSQYKDIRCRLLHAKLPHAELPHSRLNPVDVKQAYEELIRIWRDIAAGYFNVPAGGGIVTYQGFETMMNSSFSKGVRLSYTTDQSVPTHEDIEESPKNYPVNNFETTSYKSTVRLGVVQILGYEDTIAHIQNYTKPIHRICCVVEEILFNLSYIERGLKVSGVDSWEFINEIRLINSSQPNVQFKT